MEQILASALKILKTAPNGADALTIAIGGGPPEPVVAQIDRLMTPILVASGGSKYLRSSEMRPSINLTAYIEQRGPGEWRVSVARITGMAALSTIPDPTDFVGGCDAATAEAAVEGLGGVLSKFTEKGIGLELIALSYRTDKFAYREFSRDRETIARKQPRRWRDLLRRVVDQEVASFANEVVTKAFAWGDGLSMAEHLSLWFYANDEYKTVYFSMDMIKDGTFVLRIDDRIPWPWIEKKKRLRTQQEVQAAITNHLIATHNFKLKSLRVYFNYGQRIAA